MYPCGSARVLLPVLVERGAARTLFTMVMRIMGPALVTVLLFQFAVVWNTVLLALAVLSRNDLFPVPLGL